MLIRRLAAVVAALLISAAAAHAATLEDTLKAKIRSSTGMSVDQVNKTQVEGLYEVVVGRRLFYIDKTGEYLIVGKIFETATETDITSKRIEDINRVDWKTLPLKDAVRVTYGKGERKVVVFTDANCSFCSMLERNLRSAGNVTVYNFIYPILNSEAVARNIVCAKNPAKAWQNHMLTGEIPPEVTTSCDSSVLKRNLELGQKFGLNATPAILFEDGLFNQGAMSVEALDERLSATSAKNNVTR